MLSDENAASDQAQQQTQPSDEVLGEATGKAIDPAAEGQAGAAQSLEPIVVTPIPVPVEGAAAMSLEPIDTKQTEADAPAEPALDVRRFTHHTEA